MKFNMSVLSIAILLSGCATSAIMSQQATMVPANRVTLPSEMIGPVKAVFIRDTGITGSATYEHIFVDGKEAAALDPGEKVELSLQPGEHIFSVHPTDPLGLAVGVTLAQQLQEGTPYYFRIAIHHDTLLQRVNPL